MTTQVNSWVEKFKNPALYISILAAFWWFSIQLNQTEINKQDIISGDAANTSHVGTVESRLGKYILEFKDLQIEFVNYKLEMKDKEIEALHRHHKQELDIQKNSFKHQ